MGEPLSSGGARARLLERLGRLPPRPTPAAPRVDRRFSFEGVHFERWMIDGPCGPIPAWLLLPDGPEGPLPTIVALHPHGRQYELGKSLVAGLVGDGTRAYGLRAAQAGFAVLAPDMLAFEDKRPTLQERKKSYSLQGEGYERLLAMDALVRGETLQGWMLSELSSCLDALGLDARIDATRTAVLGQSYGGQQAIFGMLFDSRIRAGVSSCGFSLVRTLVEQRISHNFALYVPGLLPDLDFDQIVAAIAPRPLMVIAGKGDAIFPVAGVEAVERHARETWAAAGAANALRFEYLAGGHDLPADALSDALGWLRRALG
jgi:dienelactone hydrolase